MQYDFYSIFAMIVMALGVIALAILAYQAWKLRNWPPKK